MPEGLDYPMSDLPAEPRRDFYLRFGVAAGIPAGAVAQDRGGLVAVVAATIVVVLFTVGAFVIACWRHYSKEDRLDA